VGIGRINEKQHIVKPNLKFNNNEDCSSEDEDESNEEEAAELFEGAVEYKE
jgi:hypothetical protein